MIPLNSLIQPIRIAMALLPLVLIMILLVPVWLAAAIPAGRNQTVVLDLVDRLRGWHREILGHLDAKAPASITTSQHDT